jgi:hypothetical protein
MVQDKVVYINRIKSVIQKMEGLISFYEKQSKATDDAVCASFLKNVADKKCIQLVILERMLRNQGMEIVPLKGNEPHESDVSGHGLFEKNLEEIFNFISKQSLNDLKALSFFSMENRFARQLFKAMFELENAIIFTISPKARRKPISNVRNPKRRSSPPREDPDHSPLLRLPAESKSSFTISSERYCFPAAPASRRLPFSFSS